MKQNETPSWDAVGLPLEFFNETTRRANLNAQRKMLDKAIAEIDDFLLVQLKLADAKSVKVGDLGTIGVRTNTNVKIDPKLLLKAGVKVSQIEAATVRTESKEYVQLYPKPKREAAEGGSEDGE